MSENLQKIANAQDPLEGSSKRDAEQSDVF